MGNKGKRRMDNYSFRLPADLEKVVKPREIMYVIWQEPFTDDGCGGYWHCGRDIYFSKTELRKYLYGLSMASGVPIKVLCLHTIDGSNVQIGDI